MNDPCPITWKAYAEALEACDDDQSGQFHQTLTILTNKLGLHITDTQAHRAQLAQARALLAEFNAIRKDQIDQAAQSIDAHDLETLRLIQSLKEGRAAEKAALQSELDRLNNLRAHAKIAAENLSELRRGKPLLAHLPDPNVKELY